VIVGRMGSSVTSEAAGAQGISSFSKPRTIFIVSRLTLMTRTKSSRGYLVSPTLSVAKWLASLVMPLFLPVVSDWRSITHSPRLRDPALEPALPCCQRDDPAADSIVKPDRVLFGGRERS